MLHALDKAEEKNIFTQSGKLKSTKQTSDTISSTANSSDPDCSDKASSFTF